MARAEEVATDAAAAAHRAPSSRLPDASPPPYHPLPAHSDKTILVWELERSESNYGAPKRSLTGHSHFVQDVVISSDGQFCLSGSW